jgi:WD40 repeat protein
LCFWDLKRGVLRDVFKDPEGKDEIAADSVIYDIEYSPELNSFAYVSADKMGYIRKMADNVYEMKLVGVMQGHEADVTQVRWSSRYSNWITGSEDRTVRIWVS